MEDRSKKVRENRLRKKLDRMGYRLEKSRLRDDRAVGYGGYLIADKWKNVVVDGARPYEYCLSLNDVETFTEEKPPCLPRLSKSTIKKSTKSRRDR
jgi:hypothetical protein